MTASKAKMTSKMNEKGCNVKVVDTNSSNKRSTDHVKVTNYGTSEFTPCHQELVKKINFEAIAEKYYNEEAAANDRGNYQACFGWQHGQNLDGSDEVRLKNGSSSVPRQAAGSTDPDVIQDMVTMSKLMKLEGVPYMQDGYDDEFYEEVKAYADELAPGKGVAVHAMAYLFMEVKNGCVYRHRDNGNCPKFPWTTQVNKIIPFKEKILRATCMVWMRKSISEVVHRKRAIAEGFKFTKDWIMRSPRYLHPGKFKAQEYWDNMGNGGLTIGINVADGSFHSAGIGTKAHANKMTGYTQIVINAIEAFMEAHPSCCNVWTGMELICSLGATNNHWSWSTVVLDLAKEKNHPVLDNPAALGETAIYRTIVEAINKTTGGYSNGPNARCTIFKTNNFEDDALRTLSLLAEKVVKESMTKLQGVDTSNPGAVAKYYTEVVSALSKSNAGVGFFSGGIVAHSLAYFLAQRMLCLTTTAVAAPSVSHFKKGDSKDDKPNPHLRAYLEHVSPEHFHDSINLVQEGILFLLRNDTDVPDDVKNMNYCELENVYCEERRFYKKCDLVLPGGMSWYETLSSASGKYSILEHRPTLKSDGTVVVESVALESVDCKFVASTRPNNINWSEQLTAKEKKELSKKEFSFKLLHQQHEDVMYIRLDREDLEAMNLWGAIKTCFAFDPSVEGTKSQRYHRAVKQLQDMIPRKVIMEALVQSITRPTKNASGVALYFMKPDKRLARFTILQTASWMDKELLHAKMRHLKFYKQHRLKAVETADDDIGEKGAEESDAEEQPMEDEDDGIIEVTDTIDISESANKPDGNGTPRMSRTKKRRLAKKARRAAKASDKIGAYRT